MSRNAQHTAPIMERIFQLQDRNGCWNVLDENDKRAKEWNYYVPTYKSTLWTLILLAELGLDKNEERVRKPLGIISDYFYDTNSGIYTIGKSHFPIPCLNGNMLYLHGYFNYGDKKRMNGIIEFFNEYQRFDDGDFKTPSKFPYFSNKSCYGAHTCFWGVVKLLKGLSYVPKNRRTKSAKELIEKCIAFILLHEVCFSSRNHEEYLSRSIQFLTYPNMYESSFLEILWLLMRENVRSQKVERAYELLLGKMKENQEWELEKTVNGLVISIPRGNVGNELVTKRAREIVDFYRNPKLP